jgi:putative ABC transport system ATP-binding protein
MANLVVDDLVMEYRTGEYDVRPLDHLSFEADGELVLLLGPSGSGKTTLLSCLAGILRPTSGRILVDGTDVARLDGAPLNRYRQSTVGIVFQSFNLVPSLTAVENVEVPLRLTKVPARERRPRADRLLADVGLSDRAKHRPAELSGGQQQRVAIARALVHDPVLVLADEPTAHLDYIQVEAVVGLLRSMAHPGRTVIVATHDERLLPIADRVVELVPRSDPHAHPPAKHRLKEGEVLFEQGSRGDLVYVVDRGSVELVRTDAAGREEVLKVAGPGDYFGELSPMLRAPRTATARAREASTLTEMGLREFRARLAKPARKRAAAAGTRTRAATTKRAAGARKGTAKAAGKVAPRVAKRTASASPNGARARNRAR